MKPDYSLIDQSLLLQYIFYPRSEITPCPSNSFNLLIPVDRGTVIGCRLYVAGTHKDSLLYFHGNGEVVSDYDEIAPFYTSMGINLIVADYRGYGMSTGEPTIGSLVRDCHVIHEAVREELSEKGFTDRLFLMGRSLGSISVIELASEKPDAARGVIIESGFASVVSIIDHLNLPMPSHGPDREHILSACLDMVRRISMPCLVIHGEDDTLVPVQEAYTLHEHVGSKDKKLLVIPHADHNSVMFTDVRRYMLAIQDFMQSH
jgi:alpha-beta hydrolase superfamily lysophospholipase